MRLQPSSPVSASTRLAAWLLASATPGLAAAAGTAGPTFDCARAQGTVEQQICSDAALAALDRQLDQVYKAAAAKARGQTAQQLKAGQRGWVKGRNDCWKANGQQTWITATWTVDSVRGCIEAQYRLRTAELQAVWRLLPPRTVAYACQGNPAHEVVANYFASDPPALRLERGDRTVTLWQVGLAADGRYEGPNVDLVQQGAQASIRWLDTNTGKTEALDCRVR